MSTAEELPPDDVTRGQRTFLLWLVVLAGAALAAYLFLAVRAGSCVDGPEGSYCESFVPALAIAGAVVCGALGLLAVVKLVRR